MLNHAIKKLANSLLIALLVVLTLAPTAFAEKTNTGGIFINDTDGTEPDAIANIYSVENGDELTFTVMLENLTDPDHLNVTFDPGIEYIGLVKTHLFDGTSLEKDETYRPKNETVDADGNLVIDISNLPNRIHQLRLDLRCRMNEEIAKQAHGSCCHIQYHGKNDSVTRDIESSYVQSLKFRIKTLDTTQPREESIIDIYQGQYIDSGTYALYRDKEMTKPVYFTKLHAHYTACPENTPDAITDMTCDIGILTVTGLHEGVYYLAQTTAPDEKTTLVNPVRIELTTEAKFDPNDPENVEKAKAKKERDAMSLSEKLGKFFEEVDKQETWSDIVQKEQKEQKQLKERTEYHNTHPTQYVSYLKLDEAPRHITVINTESNADLIIDYGKTDQDAFAQIMLIILAILLILIAIIIAYILTKHHDKKPTDKIHNG